MRTYNHIYLNDEYLKNFIDEFELDKREKILVRVHSGYYDEKKAREMINSVHKILPNAKISGCSAMQIICEGKIIPMANLISVTVADKADFITGKIECFDEMGKSKSGQKLAEEVMKNIVGDKKGMLLVFFPLLYTKMEDFVRSMNKLAPGINMLGGAAYMEEPDGSLQMDRPYTINGTEISNTEASFALISEEELQVYGNYVCGVENVGKCFRAVCEECIIKKVHDIDGAKWYGQLLGEEELRKNPSISHVFPLVKTNALTNRNIAYYVDYLRNEDNNYILKSFAELENGSELSIGYFHPDKIYEQVKAVFNEIGKTPCETIFAYDCQSRAGLLHDCASWEVGNFYATDISGALLSGEIAADRNENVYANYTFAIAALSENKDSYVTLREKELKSRSELQEDNVQMLNYLLVNGNKTMNREWKDEQEKLQNAVFRNVELNIDNHLKFLFDRERETFDKVAIIWLNNLKMLRLFVDFKILMVKLKEKYNKMENASRKLGMKLYSYGECSLMVVAGPDINEEFFEESVINIKEIMESVECDDISLTYTVAMVTGETDLMKCIEKTLKFAINSKKDFVRYEEINESKPQNKDDMHMLKIIREAILQHRVVPFFQEIHDNFKCDKKMYESLMRIEDAEGKVYFPNEIIPIAKEYDLYESLSEEMVHSVIEHMRYRDVRVTINLNVRDIYNRKMMQMIFSSMRNVLYPENFVFEIVESEEIRDYAYIQEFSDRIHELGCQVAIDDFGSGFSNLLHILKIKADYIKIDGEIIKMMENDEQCLAFMDFISEWCLKTGKEVIAEYVENEKIQKMVSGLKVRYSQGYYFSKPHRWGTDDDENA